MKTLGILARGLLLSTVLTQSLSPSLALTPGQRSVLFSGATRPTWQWNFAASNALPGDGSVVVSAPSLGGLVTDANGYLTYKPNNLLLNTATLGTQGVTVGPQTIYILTIYGRWSCPHS